MIACSSCCFMYGSSFGPQFSINSRDNDDFSTTNIPISYMRILKFMWIQSWPKVPAQEWQSHDQNQSMWLPVLSFFKISWCNLCSKRRQNMVAKLLGVGPEPVCEDLQAVLSVRILSVMSKNTLN